MEQLAHFVSKAFEEKQTESEGETNPEDDSDKSKNSPVTIDLSQRNISPKPLDRISPKSEAEKKENLKNVVDGLTNSQRRIMENLYQKLDFRNSKTPDDPRNSDDHVVSESENHNKSRHKTNAMDVANLIGDNQKNSKRIDFNFLNNNNSKERLLHVALENNVNGLNESKSMESPTSEFSRGQKQHSRASSASPIIDPEDSRSSVGSGPKKEPTDNLKTRIFIGNEEDSKSGRF